MDLIFVKKLEVYTTLGVFDWERQTKQKILIDLEINLDTSKAGKSDSLEETIDYGALANKVTQFVEASSYYLAEAIASNIAAICLEDKRALSATVTVTKPTAIPRTEGVGVRITRNAK